MVLGINRAFKTKKTNDFLIKLINVRVLFWRKRRAFFLIDFYKTTKWKHKRERILKRDEYLCRECKRYGKTTAATTVHHIIPLTWCLIYNAAISLESINLISLCQQCHDKMHDRTSDKLTSLGLSWVKKMGQIGLEWIEKYSNDGW